MATTDVNIPSKVHEGKGGLWGKIIGGILGAAAAAGATALTAGAAAPAAAAALPAGTAALPVVPAAGTAAGTAGGALAATGSGLSGAAAGQTIGGVVGDVIDPTKTDPAGGGIASLGKFDSADSAPKPVDIQSRQSGKIGNLTRFAMQDPQIQSSLLDDSNKAILGHPRLSPEQKKEMTSYNELAKRRIMNPLGE